MIVELFLHLKWKWWWGSRIFNIPILIIKKLLTEIYNQYKKGLKKVSCCLFVLLIFILSYWYTFQPRFVNVFYISPWCRGWREIAEKIISWPNDHTSQSSISQTESNSKYYLQQTQAWYPGAGPRGGTWPDSRRWTGTSSHHHSQLIIHSH